ncbi:hypothetical protein DV515_00016982 [Chloebia gouldiae]|uniref:Uncharacterized protein n=1 Tax=Chloebia gouldiae TaxID=44316 RepID=A0A3L8RBG7_CHLGU|nr:hypothetical protein DV515_00016982 [Chloebia gouldiae]
MGCWLSKHARAVSCTETAKEVFLVQRGGGDVGTQHIPLAVLAVSRPWQGAWRPWHKVSSQVCQSLFVSPP